MKLNLELWRPTTCYLSTISIKNIDRRVWFAAFFALCLLALYVFKSLKLSGRSVKKVRLQKKSISVKTISTSSSKRATTSVPKKISSKLSSSHKDSTKTKSYKGPTVVKIKKPSELQPVPKHLPFSICYKNLTPDKGVVSTEFMSSFAGQVGSNFREYGLAQGPSQGLSSRKATQYDLSQTPLSKIGGTKIVLYFSKAQDKRVDASTINSALEAEIQTHPRDPFHEYASLLLVAENPNSTIFGETEIKDDPKFIHKIFKAKQEEPNKNSPVANLKTASKLSIEARLSHHI